MVYELREYVAAPGKTDALHARFEHDTLDLFAAHGIALMGFWTVRDKPGTIVYVCRFDDEAARVAAWAAFGDDPKWKAVKTASEADGPLATLSSTILEPVAYAAP